MIYKYFKQNNCPACEALDPLISELISVAPNGSVVQINVSTDPGEITSNGIQGTPTLIVLDENGNEDGRYTSNLQVESQLNALIQMFKDQSESAVDNSTGNNGTNVNNNTSENTTSNGNIDIPIIKGITMSDNSRAAITFGLGAVIGWGITRFFSK